MRSFLKGLSTAAFVCYISFIVPSSFASKAIVFDFNNSQSLESLNWELKSRGEVNTELIFRVDADKAVRVFSDDEKSMAMFTINVGHEIVRQGTSIFRADLHVPAVQQGVHLLVEVKAKGQRIFIEDMRNSPIRGNSDWKTYEIVIPQLSDASSVTLGIMMFGVGEAYLDNASLSPFLLQDGHQNSTFDGPAIAQQFYELIANSYLKSDDLNLPDFKKQLQRAGQTAGSEAELSAQLKSFVSAMGDRHMSYIDKHYSSNENGRTYRSRNTVEMRGGVAYLHLASPQSSPQYLQETIENTVRSIERLHQSGVKAWLVDLRGHKGGNSYAFLDMIYPLLPQGLASGTRDKRGQEIFNWITPEGIGVGNKSTIQKLRSKYGAAVSQFISTDIPVAVLINKGTASAGEFVALTLKERPNTKIFGERSAGLLSANAPQTLLNGDILVLPTAQAIDNAGVPQFVIRPDVLVQEPLLLKRAVKWLRSFE